MWGGVAMGAGCWVAAGCSKGGRLQQFGATRTCLIAVLTSHALGRRPAPHPSTPPTRPRPQVFVLLRRMVDNIANSDDVRALRRYPTLRREIVTAAYRALERFKEETRRMVRRGRGRAGVGAGAGLLGRAVLPACMAAA